MGSGRLTVEGSHTIGNKARRTKIKKTRELRVSPEIEHPGSHLSANILLSSFAMTVATLDTRIYLSKGTCYWRLF